MMEYKFYRLRSEAAFSGVCAGLADKYETDPNLIRLLFIVGFLSTGGTALVLYICATLLLPEKKRLESGRGDEKRLD